MTDFAKFDSMFDLDGLKKDIENAAGNTFSNEPVPHGKYEVAVQKLELVASKSSGKPMLSCWFKIVNGPQENRLLFMNQVITQGFQIHLANEFLRSLGSGIAIEFSSYSQYGELIMDIFEAIDGNKEYAVKYGERKGYDTYEIEEVFDLD